MLKFILLLLLPPSLALAQPATTPAPAPIRPHPSKPSTARINPDAPDIPIKPEKPKVAASVKPAGEDALSLQIFLDEAMFGPGIIDGKPGRFTELAVQSWNEAHGYPLDDWTSVLSAARLAVPTPLAVAVVPDWIKDWVDPNLPTKYTRQAKSKRMSYRSNGEFMAERYHCDESYLVELNSSRKIDNLEPQSSSCTIFIVSTTSPMI